MCSLSILDVGPTLALFRVKVSSLVGYALAFPS